MPNMLLLSMLKIEVILMKKYGSHIVVKSKKMIEKVMLIKNYIYSF